MTRTKSILIRLSFLLSLATCPILAITQESSAKFVPLPAIEKIAQLRVLIVNNPRFPPLSIDSAHRVLRQASSISKQYLNISVSFSEPEVVTISEIDSLFSWSQKKWISSQSLDLSLPDDRLNLRNLMIKNLAAEGGNYENLLSYSKKYLSKPPIDDSYFSFVDALVDTQYSLFQSWKSQNYSDGKPILTSDLFSHYFYWMMVGYTTTPHDVVLTNQLIASAEKSGNSIHGALRGGVSNGLTNSSRFSKSGAFSVVSSYPFFGVDSVTVGLRGNRTYNQDDAETYMAAILTHELGHQLLHLGHPFYDSACVMRPPLRLEFDVWYKGLNASECKINKSDAMTPGKTVKFSDIRK